MEVKPWDTDLMALSMKSGSKNHVGLHNLGFYSREQNMVLRYIAYSQKTFF